MALIALMTLMAALLLTAAVRSIARRRGVVDRPDGLRKLHGRPVPLWGGVAVYAATVLGLLAVRLFGGAGAEFAALSTVWIIAAGCVCFVGAIDDRFDLPARVKLALQIVSVLPIVLLGHYVDRVVAFGYPIELGWVGMFLTVLWLVGCINALNLIDGMDGLASIVGLSASAMLGVIAASRGHDHVALTALVQSAALLGFLLYNLPPASIFLGDSGSMVIGLSIGLLGIQGSLKTSATLAITAPVVVMTLPMFDIIAAVVRRKLTGRRFDAPDRLHIHHRLLDRGWTPWQVLCLAGAICLTTGAAATAATIFRRDVLAWIAAVSLVGLMIRLRLFGYEEAALVKGAVVRALRSGLGMLTRLVSIRGTGDSGLGAGDWGLGTGGLVAIASPSPESRAPSPDLPTPALWDILLRNVRTWGIHQAEFRSVTDDRVRSIRWIDPSAPVGRQCGWRFSVSLPNADGEICELRVASDQSISDQQDLAALTALLKVFGDHFAAHSDQIFGPAATFEELAPAETHSDRKRKAA